MKSIASIIAKSLLSGAGLSATRRGFPITLQRPSYANRTMLGTRRAGITTTTGRRRRNRRKNNAGLEINKAEGGYKSIVRTGAVRHLAINEYARLYLDKTGASYAYRIYLKSDEYAQSHQQIDITQMINSSEEFNDWCRAATQYKIYGIRISIDYTRVPESGDSLARLLMSVQTDKCNVVQPAIERNVMNLDMSKGGVKNFNFNFNNRNTDVSNLGWLDTADYYGAVCILKIDGQDLSFLKDTSPSNVLLGTIKFSIMAKVRLRDYISGSAKQISGNVLYRKKIQLYQQKDGKIVDKQGKEYEVKVPPTDKNAEDSGSEYEGDEEFVEDLKKEETS
jgi:hypothetical protein